MREAAVGWGNKGVSQPSRKEEVTQSCPTLCDSMDFSPPGSCVHGIFQVTILEWVAIFFSGDLLEIPGVEHGSLALQADSLPSEPQGKPSLAEIGLYSLFVLASFASIHGN